MAITSIEKNIETGMIYLDKTKFIICSLHTHTNQIELNKHGIGEAD